MIILLQSVTTQFRRLFDIFRIAKSNKVILLQNVIGCYYKVRQIVITKCVRYKKVWQTLLQSVSVIAKCDSYFKWDVTNVEITRKLIRIYLEMIFWTNCYQKSSTKRIDSFNATARYIFDRHAPSKEKRVRCNQSAFLNKNLRKAIMTRSRLLIKFRKGSENAAYEKERNKKQWNYA